MDTIISTAVMHLTVSFCAGNNHLSKLDKMLYLRQFKSLELVNLAGNPLCREANYKSYLCSHVKNIKFLDNVRVTADDVVAAMEQHQDEMLDLKEKEALQEEEEKGLQLAQQEAALMEEANLQGVDSFFDDLIKDDADWAKLVQVRLPPILYVQVRLTRELGPKWGQIGSLGVPRHQSCVQGAMSRAQVPGLTDGWSELKDKCVFEKDNFKALVLEKHQAKKAEYATWLATVKAACHEKDSLAKQHIVAFEKHKKQVVRRIHDEGKDPSEDVPATKVCP